MLQAPEANLFTGGISQAIPIRIPPGRKMATPNLNLVYSSSGGAGFYGEGWTVPVGSIERSTKWGVPRCAGSMTNEFVLTINGAAVELVSFGAGPDDSEVYRPRTDHSFLEALRKNDNTWEVFERSGLRYKFGTTAESRRTRSGTCGFTTAWGLTEIRDPNDNTAAFIYLTGRDALVLDKVQYGGDPGNQAFQVRFEYVTHPIPTTSYRSGVLEVVEDLVDRIHVEAKSSAGGSFGPVRIFDLKYDDDFGTQPPAGCDAPDRVLLCEVSVNDGLPTQSFEYASAVVGLAGGGPPPAPGGTNHLRSATPDADVEDSMMDMNGDGRLDWVNASDQQETHYSTSVGPWCATGGTIDHSKLRRETDFENGYAWTQKETIDLTGDGLPDFVDATNQVWLVYPGSLATSCDTLGTIPGFVPTAISWSAPEVFSTLTHKETIQNVEHIRTWKRLVDMNADGSPDLLVANAATGVWTVHLNSGSGFVAASDFVYGPMGPITYEIKESATQTGSKRRTRLDLFDFNGDGLPDRVESGSGTFQVRLNNGRSFDAPIPIQAVGDDAIRLVDNSSAETWADFVDVSGDGLPDRVRVAGTTWHVSVNLGTDLAGEESWGAVASSIRESNSKGNTKADMIDWNGDGLLDRVDTTDNGGVWLGVTASGPLIRPYLMTAAKNGLGGAFRATYQPSTSFPNTLLPFVSWLVTATRRTDGLCTGTAAACLASGNEVQRTYAYADGYFDGPSREFRGFGTVTESYIDSSGHISKRVVHFHQEDHLRGQIEKEETFTSFNVPVRTVTSAWRTKPPVGPRTQVYLAEMKTEEFNVDNLTDPPQCRMDRNVLPDVYGRVSTRCSLPCGTSAPGDCSVNPVGQVTTISTWADPGSGYVAGTTAAVRERPASVTVSYVKAGGASETLSQQNFTYDWPEGNVLTATTIGDSTTGGNAVVTTGYGSYGNMTSVIDPRNGQSTSSYTGTPFQLFPSSETNAVSHTVQTQWDLRYGKETQVTGPNGEVTVASYDAAGRVTCEAKPGQSCSVPSAAYTYVVGNPSAGTWEGKLSYVEVKTREPNNTTGTLPGYLLTRVYTDALGRERATATWRVVGAGNDLVWVVTKQVDYDAMGAVKRVYAPYQTGVASTGAVGLLQSPASAATVYDYLTAFGSVDPTNRVRSVTAPDGTVVATQYAAAWTHVTDQEGHKTSSEADFLGRETKRLLHEGSSTLLMQYDYTYDGLDRLLTTRVGGSGGPTVTSAWDALGRKRQVIDPDSGTWQARFDLSGNPILQDDPKTGQRVEACYDKANRVVLQCSYPSDGTASSISCPAEDPAEASCGSGTPIARYTYDDPPGDLECGGPGRIGQLTAVVDATGGECFAYDSRGRVTTQKKTILHNAVTTNAKSDFGYDQADHLLWVRYPDATLFDNGYQADGLPDSVEWIIGGVEYDLFGRATKIASLRNTEDLYAFDTTGADNFRLQTIRTWQPYPGVYHLDLAYSYEERGKLEEVLDYRDAGTPRSNAASYCYDGIGRLTKVDRDHTPGADPCAATPDETFAHNSLGNLTAKNGTSFGFAAGTHRATSFGSTYPSISYDANGSRTFKDKGGGTKDELLYDARGLLTQVKRWTGGSVTSSQTNLYDWAGTRVVRAPSSGAGSTIRTYSRYADASGGYLTKYLYLGDRMVASWVVSAPSLSEREPGLFVPPSRIPLPDELVWPTAGVVLLLLFLPLGRRRRLGVRLSLARSASLSVVLLTASFPVVLLAGCGGDPLVRLYHVDRLGSTQAVTDWSGNLYRQVRYFAYGEVRGRFDLWGNPAGYAEDARFEFTGFETDFAGLDYAGARFFDPELAQFGSHDPAGQYPSPYAYGPGDPVNGTDPSGESFLVIYAVYIAVQAVVAFIDAKNQTGSTREGMKAAGHGAADAATFGIYGGVKAMSSGEYGNYLADFYANRLTLGVYGTAKAFNNEQFAAGVVGAAGSAAAIVGLAQGIGNAYSTPVVSGDNWRMYTTSFGESGSEPTVFSYKQFVEDSVRIGSGALAVRTHLRGLTDEQFRREFIGELHSASANEIRAARLIVDQSLTNTAVRSSAAAGIGGQGALIEQGGKKAIESLPPARIRQLYRLGRALDRLGTRTSRVASFTCSATNGCTASIEVRPRQ